MIVLLKLLIAILVFFATANTMHAIRLILINALVDNKNKQFSPYLLAACISWAIIAFLILLLF